MRLNLKSGVHDLISNYIGLNKKREYLTDPNSIPKGKIFITTYDQFCLSTRCWKYDVPSLIQHMDSLYKERIESAVVVELDDKILIYKYLKDDLDIELDQYFH